MSCGSCKICSYWVPVPNEFYGWCGITGLPTPEHYGCGQFRNERKKVRKKHLCKDCGLWTRISGCAHGSCEHLLVGTEPNFGCVCFERRQKDCESGEAHDCTTIRKCKHCTFWKATKTKWAASGWSETLGRCGWWEAPTTGKYRPGLSDRYLEISSDSPGCNVFHPKPIEPFSAVMGDDCGPFSYIEFKCQKFHGSVASPDRTKELVEWLNKLWAERATTK